jgi:hypothetical protein
VSRDPTSNPADGDSGDRRRQRAGFSIFVDQVDDATGERRWESRLYHAESGAEATLPGAHPEQWIAWVLQHLGPERAGADQHRVTPGPAVEVLAVEVLDVSVTDRPVGPEDSTHTIAARVVVQVRGLSRVQRDIGARILNQLTAPWPTGDEPRS